MKTTWGDIHKKFLALHKVTGYSKMSSGSMSVHFRPHGGGVWVAFGTYDIGNYPRHYETPTFETEEGAIEFCLLELEKMKKEIEDEPEDPVFGEFKE